jgi:branched-chain amino acid transport system substrate-binding protein
VSVPITNEAGILQVSPGDGLTGLTRRLARTTARPERYYPSGRRTFVRLVPDDLEAARRVVGRMEGLGADRPVLVAGPGVYAREFADDLGGEARRASTRCPSSGASWPGSHPTGCSSPPRAARA